MVYPAGGTAVLRTHNRHLELASRMNADEDSQFDFYGVKEGDNFLVESLPHLNIINDLVIDWMHNCCLGNQLEVCTDKTTPVSNLSLRLQLLNCTFSCRVCEEVLSTHIHWDKYEKAPD